MGTDFLDLKKKLPMLGVGLGLRREIAGETFANIKEIDWLEFTPENFMRVGGQQRDILEIAASRFPLTSHGVKLSIGSSDDLDFEYLNDLKSLLHNFKVPWFSDHFCYSSADGLYLHDLLPLPRTKELVVQMSNRIRQVQDFIGRPLLLENISYYMEMPGSTYSEAEFIGEVLEKADCGLLLDLNNIVVNSLNHHFDPFEFISKLPIDRTVQIHMAGHTVQPQRVIDTHGEATSEITFQLLEKVVDLTSINAVMLERDQNFPEFEDILIELRRIRKICNASKHMNQQVTEVKPQEQVALKSIGTFAQLDGTLTQAEGNLIEATSKIGKAKTPAKTKAKKKEVTEPATRENTADTTSSSISQNQNQNFEYDVIEEALARFWLLKKDLPQELLTAKAQEGFDLYDSILSFGREHALGGMYPMCAEVLEEIWSEITVDFALEFPSTHYSLKESGSAFPQYLENRKKLLEMYPFIAELAHMEKCKLAILESEVEDQLVPFSEWEITDDLKNTRPLMNSVMQICNFNFPVHKISKTDGIANYDDITPTPTLLAIYRDPVTKNSMVALLSEQTDKLIKLASLNEFSYLALIERLAPPTDSENAIKSRMQLLDSFSTLQKIHIFVGSKDLRDSLSKN